MKTARTSERGQSLIETALILPLLLVLFLNALNFGYFTLVALHLSSASRSATEYSITGLATPSTLNLPPATPGSTTPCPSYNTGCSVSNMTYSDVNLPSFTSATVQVCSETVGVTLTGSTNPVCASCPVTSCLKGSASTFSANGTAIADPEGPSFVLQQVDVWYTFQPLISGAAFNVLVPCPANSCNFHRQAVMRAMN